MDKLKRLLKFGFVLCLIIDLTIFGLWLKTTVDGDSRLTVYFILLTILNSLIVIGAYAMLNRYKAKYDFFKQQMKVAIIGGILSLLILVPSYILKEATIPMIMLLTNSVIFLLYPNRTYDVSQIEDRDL